LRDVTTKSEQEEYVHGMVQNKQEELAAWRGVPIKPDQKEIYVLLMVQRLNVAAMRGAPSRLSGEGSAQVMPRVQKNLLVCAA